MPQKNKSARAAKISAPARGRAKARPKTTAKSRAKPPSAKKSALKKPAAPTFVQEIGAFAGRVAKFGKEAIVQGSERLGEEIDALKRAARRKVGRGAKA